MSGVAPWLWIVTGALLIVLPVLAVRRLGRRVLGEVLRLHPEPTLRRIDPMANLFGLQSRGRRQIRGNGVLLATSEGLYFRMLLPGRVIDIPLADITGFGTESRFLGKSCGAPLLRVDYRSGGATESAAWAVRDLDGWLSTLATLRREHPQREG